MNEIINNKSFTNSANIKDDFDSSQVKNSLCGFISKYNADYILANYGEWIADKSKTTFRSLYELKK